jgi:hypothetical protein
MSRKDDQMKRLWLLIAVVMVLGSLAAAGVAYANTQDLYISAYWVPGDPTSGGTMIGHHDYTSYSSTQWRNTQMRFIVGQQVTRNSNDVKYYIYSDNSLVHSKSYTTIVGNTNYTKSTGVYSQKKSTTHAGTYSSWYVMVDVNNFPDPDGWDYTPAF